MKLKIGMPIIGDIREDSSELSIEHNSQHCAQETKIKPNKAIVVRNKLTREAGKIERHEHIQIIICWLVCNETWF